MKPTLHINRFHYNNLTITIDPQVYNPAEDTYLLLKSLHYKNNNNILEIGTGCGIIALSCAQQGPNVTATDLNPYALRLTKKNIKLNHTKIKGRIALIQGNLFDMIKPNSLYDTIIFNPPYLPTNTKNKLSGWINNAFDGGKTGIKVIKPFLQKLPNYLKKEGNCFFVGSSLQDTNQLKKTIDQSSLTYQIINQQLIGDEYLQIYQVNQIQ